MDDKYVALPESRRHMGRGRPKGFDRDEALDKALTHFYAHGYQGSGMTDLLEQMGIARQSLYSAFGDKKRLFLEVIDRYDSMQMAQMTEILQAPGSPLENVKNLLRFAGQMALDPRYPGCLVGNTVAELGVSEADVTVALQDHFKFAESEIGGTLKRAKDAGELPKSVNCRALAHTLCCVVQGLFIRTKLNPDPQYIQDVVETAISLID